MKLWQDIFSEWPFERPIVDYWIWAAPESNITASETYTLIDMLADVGGLVFIVGVIGRGILDTCSKGNLAATLASRLYTWRDETDEAASPEPNLNNSAVIQFVRKSPS